MVFIETSIFTKLINNYLIDDENLGLQKFLLLRPDSGAIVRGTGGVRKLRWAIRGKGKSERDSISAHILKQIAKEIKND